MKLQDFIQNRTLQAYYQPQYDALKNCIVSAEALTRLINEDSSVVYPQDFLPALEETNAVCELDWMMVHLVCDTLAQQVAEGLKWPPCQDQD